MVTAVLISWKRPQNFALIVPQLLQLPFIDEVIIRDNSANNLMTYSRYLAGLCARNDILYTQDDDAIIKNISEIYEQYDGVTPVTGLKVEAIKDEPFSMAGWGTFFRKRDVDCLKKYTDKYGFDDVFYRETDRIFTYLMKAKKVVADVEDIGDVVHDPLALSSQRDHIIYKEEAIKRCLAL